MMDLLLICNDEESALLQNIMNTGPMMMAFLECRRWGQWFNLTGIVLASIIR
jgi:hypothetical protein